MPSLIENRRNLEIDVNKFIDNIDTYRGRLVYFNHDIGTGKSYQFCKHLKDIKDRINSAQRNNKIVIFCSSYKIAKEWYDNIINNSFLESENIYRLCAPDKISDFIGGDCPKAEVLSRNKSIDSFSLKVCTECLQGDDWCLKDYRSKIESSSVVITSHAVYLQNPELFNNFDIYIFDEAANIHDIITIKASKISILVEELQSITSDNSDYSSNLNNVIDSLNSIRSQATEFEISYKCKDSYIDDQFLKLTINPELKTLIETLIQLLKTKKINTTKRRDLLKSISSILELLETNQPAVCIMSKKAILENGKMKWQPDECLIKSRFHINVTPLTEGNGLFVVLSANNSRDYIAHLFETNIDDECCFGENLVNEFPNVVTTSYKRKNDYHGPKKSSFGNRYSQMLKENITNTITEVIKLHENDKIAVCGYKDNESDVLTGDLTGLIGFELDVNNHKFKIVTYDDYMASDSKQYLIPYIHFGMSGFNTLADFRALVMISNYATNPEDYCFYADSELTDFKISQATFLFNLNNVVIHQAEGRMYRFTPCVRMKYIYRIMTYRDYSTRDQQFPDYNSDTIYFGRFNSLNDFLSKNVHDLSLYKRKKFLCNETIKSLASELKTNPKAKEIILVLKFIEFYVHNLETVSDEIDEIAKGSIIKNFMLTTVNINEVTSIEMSTITTIFKDLPSRENENKSSRHKRTKRLQKMYDNLLKVINRLENDYHLSRIGTISYDGD